MARKLAFYSDLDAPANAVIHRRLLSLLGKPRPTLGYVPSSDDPERFWYAKTNAHYTALGFSPGVYLDLFGGFSESDLAELLRCDAIHLSGGPTFYFLLALKRHDLLQPLRDYAASGGVLIGVSAGAMIMTPNIASARLCGDELVEGQEDFEALNLVDFQFLPHFERTEASTAALEEHHIRHPAGLYACSDGGGIIVEGSSVELFGPVQKWPV